MKRGALHANRGNLFGWQKTHLVARILFTETLLAPAPPPPFVTPNKTPRRLRPETYGSTTTAKNSAPAAPLPRNSGPCPNARFLEQRGDLATRKRAPYQAGFPQKKRNWFTLQGGLSRSTHIQRKSETWPRRGSIPKHVTKTLLREQSKTTLPKSQARVLLLSSAPNTQR